MTARRMVSEKEGLHGLCPASTGGVGDVALPVLPWCVSRGTYVGGVSKCDMEVLFGIRLKTVEHTPVFHMQHSYNGI